ncbi:MAG: hypothetical protein K8H99_04980 [Nitrospirae bacterium]|nr:hypothetical protein [Fimbriimonadaceae bacterium]
MLPLRLLLLSGIAVALIGCGNSGGNAAGPEADSGKTYTVEDANSAQPKRGAAINEDESR